MSTLREALDIPVVSKDSAEQLGKVSGFALDPASHEIHSVHVGGSKRSARFVTWDRIASFGADALMVESTDAARDAEGPAEERVAAGHGDILDKRVLTDAGDDLGTVDDVEFDVWNGTITTITTNGQAVSGTRFLGVGAYAVVVRADGPDVPPPPG